MNSNFDKQLKYKHYVSFQDGKQYIKAKDPPKAGFFHYIHQEDKAKIKNSNTDNENDKLSSNKKPRQLRIMQKEAQNNIITRNHNVDEYTQSKNRTLKEKYNLFELEQQNQYKTKNPEVSRNHKLSVESLLNNQISNEQQMSIQQQQYLLKQKLQVQQDIKSIQNDTKLKRFQKGDTGQYESVALMESDLDQIDKFMKTSSNSVEKIAKASVPFEQYVTPSRTERLVPTYEQVPIREENFVNLAATPPPKAGLINQNGRHYFSKQIFNNLQRSHQKALEQQQDETKGAPSPYEGLFNLNVKKLKQNSKQPSSGTVEHLQPFVPYKPTQNFKLEEMRRYQQQMTQLREQQKYNRGGLLKTSNGTIIYNGSLNQRMNQVQTISRKQSIMDTYMGPAENNSMIYMIDHFGDNDFSSSAQPGRKTDMLNKSDDFLAEQVNVAGKKAVKHDFQQEQEQKRQVVLSTLESRYKSENETGGEQKKKVKPKEGEAKKVKDPKLFTQEQEDIEYEEVRELRRQRAKEQREYIKTCRQGNEHYTNQKLNSLKWLNKEQNQKELEAHLNQIASANQKLAEKLKMKQEISAKYTQMSKENGVGAMLEDGYYRFQVLRGNNSKLVRRVLETRENWTQLPDNCSTSLFDFKWSPTSRICNFEMLSFGGHKSMVNHLEFHGQITTKDMIYHNMHRLCEMNKLNVFDYLPIQFVFDFSQMNFTSEIDKFCTYFNILKKVSKENQDGNQDEALAEINRQITVSKHFGDKRSSRKFKLGKEMYDDQNIWLIKPNDFNRGRGVSLFNSLGQLKTLLKEFTQGSNKEIDYFVNTACITISQNEGKRKQVAHEPAVEPAEVEKQTSAAQGISFSANVKSEVFVVQKYIERPLLIDQRKFDIRLWVLISFDSKCYLFQEGYIRTSSYKYSLESIDQPMIHLTNNAVQQYDENYGKLEEGNQLSFNQASAILKEQQNIRVDFNQIVKEQIKPVIEMTLKCAETKLNPNQRKHCFEIFGYDFMIDESLHAWLIEINTNPCLEETSKLLKDYLPRMLDDAFKLTIDVIFPNCNKQDHDQPFKIEGYDDNANMWEHIYTQKSAKTKNQENVLQ